MPGVGAESDAGADVVIVRTGTARAGSARAEALQLERVKERVL